MPTTIKAERNAETERSMVAIRADVRQTVAGCKDNLSDPAVSGKPEPLSLTASSRQHWSSAHPRLSNRGKVASLYRRGLWGTLGLFSLPQRMMHQRDQRNHQYDQRDPRRPWGRLGVIVVVEAHARPRCWDGPNLDRLRFEGSNLPEKARMPDRCIGLGGARNAGRGRRPPTRNPPISTKKPRCREPVYRRFGAAR